MSHKFCSRMIVLISVLWITGGCGGGTDVDNSTSPAGELSRDEQKQFESLTIREIMQGPGMVGTAPTNPRFGADGFTVYFDWNSPERLDSLNAVDPSAAYENYLDVEDDAGVWALDVASGQVRPLKPVDAAVQAPTEGAWDTEHKRRAEIRGGDVYLVDAEMGVARRITGTLAAERNVQISPTGSAVYFERDNNVYRVGWSDGFAEQVTDLRTGKNPDEPEDNEQRKYLIEQQEELFSEFKKRDEPKDETRPETIYLGEGFDVQEMSVSPSGRYVAVEVSKSASGTRKPIVPVVVTESGYLETEETRPKVGEAQDKWRIGVVDLSVDSLMWIDTDDDMYVVTMSWSPTDDVLLARGITADWHDRYFYLVDPAAPRNDDGELTTNTIDHYHDDAWVGGPNFYNTGSWLPNGSAVYFVCESTGYNHLYLVTRGGRRSQLTSGDWEVHAAYPDVDRDRWYIVGNKDRPGSSRVWQMPLAGGEMELVTPEFGDYQLTFSGDMRRAAVLHSTVNHPSELYVYDAERNELLGPHTESTTDLFRQYAWSAPQEVTFPASDGERVRAHIFAPSQFGARPNGAGVVFIHGAGYLQNVTDTWSYYYREYMFHHLLASRGYVVANVDYRGSAGYGRKCRVAIYKHMGGRDLDDIVDAAKYLKRQYGVDEDRAGVYGGSYGGFLTLMAMFKNPDEIASGAALRSVTDWAHYNHWYTSRILGLPSEDPDAYRRSSPIYFADGFDGHLLMLHGLRDTNVLSADILRLSQRLIELGKENWELQIHPAEGHAYHSASSWTDQMRRVYKLFEETIGVRK